MAGKKAADDETAPHAPDLELNLQRLAVGPALALDSYATAVAQAMAIAAENAAAQQQKTMLLAMALTAKSVRLVLDGPETPQDSDDPDLDLHRQKEA